MNNRRKPQSATPNIAANQSLSPPDAIHLACAAQARIDLFLTNDNDLIGKVIPGI